MQIADKIKSISPRECIHWKKNRPQIQIFYDVWINFWEIFDSTLGRADSTRYYNKFIWITRNIRLNQLYRELNQIFLESWFKHRKISGFGICFFFSVFNAKVRFYYYNCIKYRKVLKLQSNRGSALAIVEEYYIALYQVYWPHLSQLTLYLFVTKCHFIFQSTTWNWRSPIISKPI